VEELALGSSMNNFSMVISRKAADRPFCYNMIYALLKYFSFSNPCSKKHRVGQTIPNLSDFAI
jgi:hypothetical protein